MNNIYNKKKMLPHLLIVLKGCIRKFRHY